MSPQQTLRHSVSLSGVGLHSGNRVQMTLLPAPASAGIRFRRVDLEGKPEIDARVEHVVDTERSTSLGKGSVKIHTVEHVLAAFAGAGIQNAIIELDANEPPIMDGSSREFARALREAGAQTQSDPVDPIRILEPIEIRAGESHLILLPADQFQITCTSSDRLGRFTQFHSTPITPATWERDIAHARTFCFYEEIEYLIKSGLIRGGSLENAIVIREDAVLTTEPLRYPNEFVRHKILDIIGDLSLVGRPILGHIVAVRPGHTANSELAKAILEKLRKPVVAAQTFAPPPTEVRESRESKKNSPPAPQPATSSQTSSPSPERPTTQEKSPPPVDNPVQDGAVLDVIQVMKILPHRPPFLMVDRIIRIEGNRVTGLKNVSMNEPFFEGHFPGHPIMPGVLQLEAIAQVAGILMMRQAENAGKLAYFMSAENVKWRKPVRPGDVLTIDVELTKSRGKIGKAKGTCLVDQETVSEAEVTFILVER